MPFCSANSRRNYRLDGLASVTVGMLLVGSALWQASSIKDLLIGHSADEDVVRGIRDLVERQAAVCEIAELMTLHMGPEYVLVNLRVRFADNMLVQDIEEVTFYLERQIQECLPIAKRVYVRPVTPSNGLRFPDALFRMPNSGNSTGACRMNIDAGERLVGRQALREALQPVPRWLAAIAVAVLVFIPIWASSGQGETALLAGWDAGILTCLIVTFLMSRSEKSRQGLAQEPARAFALLTIAIAAVVGLVGALALAGQIGRPASMAQGPRVGLAMAAVVVSWLLVRTECRLHLVRLRLDMKRSGSASPAAVSAGQETTASLDVEKLGLWGFIYYAFPIVRLDDPADPVPVTPGMCQVAILHSIVMYASVAILISFGLSLIGPGLNDARVVLGG